MHVFDSTIPATILEQLGGDNFAAMTGVKNIYSMPDAIGFDLPRGLRTQATNVVITLDEESDTYTIEFQRWIPKRMDFALVKSHEEITWDQLLRDFEGETGLHIAPGGVRA